MLMLYLLVKSQKLFNIFLVLTNYHGNFLTINPAGLVVSPYAICSSVDAPGSSELSVKDPSPV